MSGIKRMLADEKVKVIGNKGKRNMSFNVY